jgi:hypothetical protein
MLMASSRDLCPSRSGGVAFIYNNYEVGFDANRLVDVTQMWRANGEVPSKDPRRWAETEQAKGFINTVARTVNLAKNEVWKSKRGKHLAGTWAHWQVALAYAKYLSHEFHRFVNEAFREWAAEKANPDLKVERAAQQEVRGVASTCRRKFHQGPGPKSKCHQN